jgi:hypothetical protein
LATLAGSETFTNKTLTSPAIGGTPTGVGILTSGTVVASTSGTSIDFTSIPSWVKRITVMFSGVSISGNNNLLIQVGSGSISSTGYVSTSTQTSTTSGSVSSTAGFLFYLSNAAYVCSGLLTIDLISSNTWIASGVIGTTAGVVTSIFGSGASPALSGSLDRVRITTSNGTDTFDAGSINILYE